MVVPPPPGHKFRSVHFDHASVEKVPTALQAFLLAFLRREGHEAEAAALAVPLHHDEVAEVPEP